MKLKFAVAPIVLLGMSLSSALGAATAPVAIASSAGSVPDGFSLAADGTTLVHVASGFRFPARLAGFTRLKEQAFDPSGHYVAIGYDRPLGGSADHVVVRIALVHIRDMSAHDHYTIMKSAAMAHFSAPAVLSEGPVPFPADPQLSAWRGIFTGTRNGQPWRFSLTTVDYGYWSGRLTAAYPQSRAAEAEQDLAALIPVFRWQRPVKPKR